MSLTSQIKERTWRAEILLSAVNPPKESVPPRKIHHKGRDWALIGTAFDYLVRMAICNKNSLEFEPSIAEIAVQKRTVVEEFEQLDFNTFLDFQREKQLAQKYVLSEDKGIREYQWAYFALKFAKLDPYFRAGYWNAEWNNAPRKEYVDELVELLDLWEEKYTVGEEVDLNPVFGSSHLWGGADGDIIDDGCMIDWKVVNHPKLGTADSLKHWAQVFAYALMAIKDGKNISHVAIYYARHGMLVKKPIEEVCHWPIDSAIDAILYEEEVVEDGHCVKCKTKLRAFTASKDWPSRSLHKKCWLEEKRLYDHRCSKCGALNNDSTFDEVYKMCDCDFDDD